MWVRRGILAAIAFLGLAGAGGLALQLAFGPADLAEVRRRVTPGLQAEVAAKGLGWGAPIFVRIFKEERALELWVRSGDRFRLLRTYPICAFSGDLGPKLKQGDRQAPEGFYFVPPAAMNPQSRYHLSFNLGYPNAYDRAHGRTGNWLMVHGSCFSIGCYAMTDAAIEEIYLMAEAAFAGGQPFFRVHIFPFRMTAANMARHAGAHWQGFWQNLRQGYDLFEASHLPPEVTVAGGAYGFAAGR